jgi:hypothetical membrane protein
MPRPRSETLESLFLRAAIAVPILYFSAVFVGAAFYPNFSLIRQFASELGMDAAPHPWILNTGIILAGLLCIIGSAGFNCALKRLQARPILTRWFTAFIGCLGFALIMAGIFPHPDWRHSGFGLGFPIVVAPALLAVALPRGQGHARLRRYLIFTNVVMIGLIIAFVLATHSPVVGLCQLLYTIAAVPWIGVAAHALRTRPMCA